MRIDIWIDGDPKGQPRTRSTRAGRHYTPNTADGWRSRIADALRPHRPETPIDAPVVTSMKFCMRRPKNLMGKKHPDGEVPFLGRPDKDNLEKAVMDECVQVGLLRDDSLIFASERIEKVYHAKDGRPGMQLSIWTVNHDAE